MSPRKTKRKQVGTDFDDQNAGLDGRVIRLSEHDQQIFVAALLNPPPPNKALLAAVKRHAKMVGEEP